VADLVTHLCSALLPGAFLRGRLLPLVAVGTALPDLFGRAVPLALEAAAGAGAPVPPSLLWPWTALHEPFGWMAVGVALGAAFVEDDRRAAILALWSGCALHTLLDVLQHHHGAGYLLLAPLSAARFELGWIGSEVTVPLALPLAAVTVAAWLPAAVEAAGVLPSRPRALLWLLVPMVASGVAGSGWGAVAGLAFAGATWRWWRHPREYLAVGGVLVAAAAAVLAVAMTRSLT
jgi:hypothetical protein